jgi:hypothetical protein
LQEGKLLDDVEEIVFVTKEGESIGRMMKKSEADRRSDIHKVTKRDWVKDEDGVARWTIVGDEYVEDR